MSPPPYNIDDMERLAEYLSVNESGPALAALGAETGATEFARVRNIDYVFAPYELYPLAPPPALPLERIVAFAVDMDGTSTTTEPLALHSLEYMVRRFTGRLTAAEWPGLDRQLDYPYVIGNSNFRHTEFLVGRYRDQIDRGALRKAFIEAVCWTLASMTDPQRRRDIVQNAVKCGLAGLLSDDGFQRVLAGGTVTTDTVGRLAEPFVRRFGPAFECRHEGELVGAALDVYYMRYHSIMRLIEEGKGEQLSQELLGQPGRHLIEPMPGYDVFVALIKGWLGPEVDALYEPLREHLLGRPELGHTRAELDGYRPRLVRLAEYFGRQPARLALVTASIAYEAHASMKEVTRVMREQVRTWPVPAACRDRVAERLADYLAVFDAFVNASDACEHRLKPHRDLYSLALHQMSIPKSDYACCVGLEDTEPGIIALRASGIGCAVALPNHDTSRQNYQAAIQVVRGGLPELILARNLLLK
jgi:beta-phosphoglucomutase-like phosphatase (HAD superfamily)